MNTCHFLNSLFLFNWLRFLARNFLKSIYIVLIPSNLVEIIKNYYNATILLIVLWTRAIFQILARNFLKFYVKSIYIVLIPSDLEIIEKYYNATILLIILWTRTIMPFSKFLFLLNWQWLPFLARNFLKSIYIVLMPSNLVEIIKYYNATILLMVLWTRAIFQILENFPGIF